MSWLPACHRASDAPPRRNLPNGAAREQLLDSLNLLRAFSEVAGSGSFSRAASQLALSRGTVSKYIATLESRFGVRLLNRTSHAVSLTDAGVLLLERSKPMLELVEETRAELQDRALTPRGRLRVSAPHGMEQTQLPALINTFLGHYPEVSISLVLTNRIVDLAEDGIDVALRFAPTANENLIVRKLVAMDLSVCAAPMYWSAHGMPVHPNELASHNALVSTHLSPQSKWRFEVDGAPLEVPVRGAPECHGGRPVDPGRVTGSGYRLFAYGNAGAVYQEWAAGARVVGIRSQRHVAVGCLLAAAAQYRCTACLPELSRGPDQAREACAQRLSQSGSAGQGARLVGWPLAVGGLRCVSPAARSLPARWAVPTPVLPRARPGRPAADRWVRPRSVRAPAPGRQCRRQAVLRRCCRRPAAA
ncbi:DNA-binding transcriptional LysR family regulator [Variovorax paradoxus]|nr:DNA-binding transcriptional LysR family regulator [Variovorax paradoxus]